MSRVKKENRVESQGPSKIRDSVLFFGGQECTHTHTHTHMNTYTVALSHEVLYLVHCARLHFILLFAVKSKKREKTDAPHVRYRDVYDKKVIIESNNTCSVHQIRRLGVIGPTVADCLTNQKKQRHKSTAEKRTVFSLFFLHLLHRNGGGGDTHTCHHMR